MDKNHKSVNCLIAINLIETASKAYKPNNKKTLFRKPAITKKELNLKERNKATTT